MFPILLEYKDIYVVFTCVANMSDMPPFLSKTDEKNEEDEFETSTEFSDWDLPLCFDQPRHLEAIKGEERVEHTWRLKEKVSNSVVMRQSCACCRCIFMNECVRDMHSPKQTHAVVNCFAICSKLRTTS